MSTEGKSNEQTAPSGPFVRLRLLVAYDGSSFRGFAYQSATLPTVARELRRAMAPMWGYEPELTVAGRTDAGVHAWGQVVSVDIPEAAAIRFDCERIRKSLNNQLSNAVVVREVSQVVGDFDARFSATGRTYKYTVNMAATPSPFDRHLVWHVGEDLDVAAMNEACDAIIGEHDFTSFCKRPEDLPDGSPRSLVRRVTQARWEQQGSRAVFEVSANAFCHQQVRSLVGMLVAIGRGRRAVSDMAKAIDAKDRSAIVSPAPPEGLCLWEVQY